MLRRPLRRRAGFSLVEVLVALFIVAAGLIALLTLFPLGAVQMGKALQDDRSQQCALQADGKIRELWRQRVLDVNPNAADPYFSTTDPFYTALNYFDDNDGVGVGTGTQPAIGATHRASYPVMIDAVGHATYTGAKQTSTAGGGTFLRRQHPLALGLIPAVRMCTLQDDMEFGPDGTPADRDGLSVNASGGQIFRAGRYNWAAVIQRPDNLNRTVADLKILVFDRRVPGVNPTAPDNELRFPINNVFPGLTQLTFNQSNDVLGLRVGSWVLDGTNTLDANGDTVLGDSVRNANFYRVTAVDADTNPAQVTVELQTPLSRTRGDANPTAAYNGTFYLFRELIDVYDRPQLAPSGYQKQTP